MYSISATTQRVLDLVIYLLVQIKITVLIWLPKVVKHLGKETVLDCFRKGNLEELIIGTSKLTAAEVCVIRKEYKAGKTTYPKLASEYNMSYTQIGRIIRGSHWKEL